MLGLPYLSLTKKIILSLVTFFLVLIIALSIYLKVVAKDMIRNAINNLEIFYPQISNITYQSTNFALWDFFTETLTVNNITITLNDTEAVFHIDQIKIHNFMGLKQDPYGSFELSFRNLTVNSLQDLSTTLATWSNNAYLYSELGNIPNNINLGVNGEVRYDANPQTLGLNLGVLEDNQSILNYQTTLSPLPLSSELLSNQTNFLNALNQTAIVSSHYQLQFDETFAIADVESAFPLIGNFLQNLGYHALPVHLDAQSDYQGGQNQEIFHADINIKGLADLHLDWTLIFGAPLSPYNFANFLLNPGNPTYQENPPMIQSADITYTDQSFMNKLFNYLSTSMHQPISNIQSMIQTLITNYAQQTNIPEFTSISNELTNFIANPGTLSFNLNPAIPFSFNDVLSFFAFQQQLNTMMIENMSKLSSEQKGTLFNRYESSTAQAYSNFFHKIGLSVIANTAVNTN